MRLKIVLAVAAAAAVTAGFALPRDNAVGSDRPAQVSMLDVAE